MALALARPMARMQVEVERQIQMHRRSPVADLVSQPRKTKEFVYAYESVLPIFNLRQNKSQKDCQHYIKHHINQNSGGMNHFIKIRQFYKLLI